VVCRWSGRILANGGQTGLQVDGEGLWPWRADVRHSRPATGTQIWVPLTCGNIQAIWLHFIQPRFGIVSFYQNKVVFFSLYQWILVYIRACGSVVVKAPCYQLEGRGFKNRWDDWIFSIYLILPDTLGPGIYSASNRNEYQKHKNNNVSGE
jgi:hypothetical protein